MCEYHIANDILFAVDYAINTETKEVNDKIKESDLVDIYFGHLECEIKLTVKNKGA